MLQPITSGFGARIKGGLGALSPKAVVQALYKHKVLHFPCSEPMDQTQFIDWFERLGVAALPQRGREQASGEVDPRVFVLSDRGDKSPFLSAAPLELHSDLSYRRQPGTLSALLAVATPQMGGDTHFVDCAAAFASLDSTLQHRLRGMSAVHAHPESHMNVASEMDSGSRGVCHPVVRPHPETGQEALFISPFFTTTIDPPSADGDHLLTQLFEVLSQPEFCYSHGWQTRDVVLWDNRNTLHGRQSFKGERVLWRAQARGQF